MTEQETNAINYLIKRTGYAPRHVYEAWDKAKKDMERYPGSFDVNNTLTRAKNYLNHHKFPHVLEDMPNGTS